MVVNGVNFTQVEFYTINLGKVDTSDDHDCPEPLYGVNFTKINRGSSLHLNCVHFLHINGVHFFTPHACVMVLPSLVLIPGTQLYTKLCKFHPLEGTKLAHTKVLKKYHMPAVRIPVFPRHS